MLKCIETTLLWVHKGKISILVEYFKRCWEGLITGSDFIDMYGLIMLHTRGILTNILKIIVELKNNEITLLFLVVGE